MDRIKKDWQLEFKLNEITKNGKDKDIEWYKSELKAAEISFLEISVENRTMVVPEYVFNRMSQRNKNKLLKMD